MPEIAVPQGFAVTAAAYELFLAHNELQEEINRRLQSLEEEDIGDIYRKSSEVQMLIIGAEVPPELAEAIARAYAWWSIGAAFPSAAGCSANWGSLIVP